MNLKERKCINNINDAKRKINKAKTENSDSLGEMEKLITFIESNVKVPGLKNIRDEILQYKNKINKNNENLDTLNKRLDTQIEKIRTIAKLREEAEQFGINK